MKYSIRKTLAFNKHAEVLLADYNDPIHPSLALVKTTLPSLSEEVMEQLKFAKSLNHKNLLNLIDFGKCKNYSPIRYYIASRYIPGVTLTQVLSKLDILHKKAPIPFVLHIIFSLCNALEYIHETACGTKDKETLLHGNICPDNILITYDGDVFLLDAGISNIMTDRYTGTMLVKNSETIFHHPEARFGHPCKPSHELYSLSLLFLSLLVGKNHFEQFYERKDPLRIKSIGKAFPSIPDDIVKIITKGTRFKGIRRLMRFESVGGFYHALLECSFMQSTKYMKEITSLIIYTLFNHHTELSDTHHQEQRVKALQYIKEGSDNSLKVLLRDRLNMALPEEKLTDAISDTGTDILDDVFDTFTEPKQPQQQELSPDYFPVTAADSASSEENSLQEDGTVPESSPVPSNVPQKQKKDGNVQGDKESSVPEAVTSAEHTPKHLSESENEQPAAPSSDTTEGRPASITEILNIEQLLKKSSPQNTAAHTSSEVPPTEPSINDHPISSKEPALSKSNERTRQTAAANHKTPFFIPAKISSNHPFSKIVTRPHVVDADIFTRESLLASLGAPRKTSGPAADASLESPFDSFATLMKNKPATTGNKHLEPFSNLLKKEPDHL